MGLGTRGALLRRAMIGVVAAGAAVIGIGSPAAGPAADQVASVVTSPPTTGSDAPTTTSPAWDETPRAVAAKVPDAGGAAAPDSDVSHPPSTLGAPVPAADAAATAATTAAPAAAPPPPAAAPSAAPNGPRPVTLSGSQAEGLRLLNRARADAGLAPLTAVSDAQAKAQAHAERLAESRSLDHSSDLSAGIEDGWRNVGENVARAASVADCHRELMGHDTHRANILDPGFNQVGVGVAVADGEVTLVQFFVER